MERSVIRTVVVVTAFVLGALPSTAVVAAGPSDWSAVPTSTVKLFYPGQSSFQWLRQKEHKKAVQKTRQGEPCLGCHEEEEENLGEKMVSGERLEPTPIDGKPGTLDLAVQAAHDGAKIYLRLSWESSGSGVAGTHLRFDGTAWQPYGGSRLDRDVLRGRAPALAEDAVAVMIDDGAVPMFEEHGCWLTCHDGMPDMKREARGPKLTNHPLLGPKGGVTKYLPRTRANAFANWDRTRPDDEITAIKGQGAFADLIQWRAGLSDSGMAIDSYVLATREEDEGQTVMERNWDDATSQPKYMYDESKTGFKAAKDTNSGYLLPGANAKPFDAAADWQEGDMLPAHVAASGSGSAADVTAEGTFENGRWSVVIVRALDTGHDDDKALRAGETVVVGFAVHDDATDSRAHFVSFPLLLGIGTDGDISAIAL